MYQKYSAINLIYSSSVSLNATGPADPAINKPIPLKLEMSKKSTQTLEITKNPTSYKHKAGNINFKKHSKNTHE